MPPEIVAKVPASRSVSREALRALRVHHWTKNLIVFAPVVAGHRIGEPATFLRAALAAIAFSLAASAGYLVNDALDVATDREHPRKRMRPFASGALPLGFGLAAFPVLLGAAAAVSALLPGGFRALLAGYVLFSVAYSAWLKRFAALDVVVLAALYTARIHAGGLATGIEVSDWLGTFSMFLFVSLALLKRASEILELPPGTSARQGYEAVDREAIFGLGPAAGYVAVLVLALYVSSPDVARHYAQPRLIWLLCPILLFWLSRLWLLARRGRIREDPLVFTASDLASWCAAVAATVVVWLAT